MHVENRGELAMFMEMFMPAVYNPCDESENRSCDGYCNEGAKKHLIFSSRVNKICDNNIAYEKHIDAKNRIISYTFSFVKDVYHET